MDFLTLFDFYRKLNDKELSVDDVTSIIESTARPNEYRKIIDLGIRQYLSQKFNNDHFDSITNNGVRNSEMICDMYDQLRVKYNENARQKSHQQSVESKINGNNCDNDDNSDNDNDHENENENEHKQLHSTKSEITESFQEQSNRKQQISGLGTFGGIGSGRGNGNGNGNGGISGINSNSNSNSNGWNVKNSVSIFGGAMEEENAFIVDGQFCAEVLNTAMLNCKIFSFLDLESLMQCSVVCVNWLFDSYHPSSIGYLNTKMIVKYVDSSDITPAMVLNFNNLMFGSLKSPKKQDSASSSSSDSDDTDEKKEEMVDNSQTQQV